VTLNPYNTVLTPCIGVCSTGIGDSVCRGCKRFEHEVIQWNGYTQSQKQSIDNRLSAQLSNVVSQRLLIVDVELLESQLKSQQIRYAEYRDPYCWLYELLRAGATQITASDDFGFKPRSAYQNTPLTDIRDIIDMEFYVLSVAHYERYILANSARANCVSEAVTSNE